MLRATSVARVWRTPNGRIDYMSYTFLPEPIDYDLASSEFNELILSRSNSDPDGFVNTLVYNWLHPLDYGGLIGRSWSTAYGHLLQSARRNINPGLTPGVYNPMGAP